MCCSNCFDISSTRPPRVGLGVRVRRTRMVNQSAKQLPPGHGDMPCVTLHVLVFFKTSTGVALGLRHRRPRGKVTHGLLVRSRGGVSSGNGHADTISQVSGLSFGPFRGHIYRRARSAGAISSAFGPHSLSNPMPQSSHDSVSLSSWGGSSPSSRSSSILLIMLGDKVS